MYRENKKWKGKKEEKKEDRELVRKSAEVLGETVKIPEEILLEIIGKKLADKDKELTGKELIVLNSMGTRKQILHEVVTSQMNLKNKPIEEGGKPSMEITPKAILELFKERTEMLTKPPFVVVVKTSAPTVPAPTTPATPAPTVAPTESTTKERVLWEGKKRERQPMRYEEEPEGRHDNILWGTPKRYDFGRGQVEATVKAYSNGKEVWLVFSTPLEDKDLGYPRPIVIPWGKEAEFGNIFRTDLPAFSQETTLDKIVIVRSSVHFAQEVLQKKGPVAVLFKGEEFCLIHVGDEKLRRRVEQNLNHAQKETTGKNPWITTRLGLLRSPEYRVSDETVLEVLQTAVAAAKAREEKKVTVSEKTVTQKMQEMGFLR